MRTRPQLSRWRAPASPPTTRRAPRAWVTGGLAVAAASAIVLSFYLSVFPTRDFTVPVGWDQSEYLWRTTLAQEVGVHRIDEPLPALPSPKSGRPAFPVVAGALSSLFGVDTFRLAMVLPSVMAASVALAAGGFVATALRRSAWEAMAVALGVALSPLMARLMAPEAYMDTMFAGAVFLAAAAAIALSMEDRRALLPAVVLAGAGAAIHWPFFGFFALTLALTGLFLLPGSWRAWRRGGAPLLDTPTARLAGVAVGGAALGTGVLFGLLSDSYPSPRLDESEFAKKLRRDLPKYKLPFTLPVAVLGLWSLAGGSRPGLREGRARARFVLSLLVAWCAVVLGGVLARSALGLPVPGHRFLSFALAVPILGVLAAVWVGGLIGGWAGRRAAGAVWSTWLRTALGGSIVAAVLAFSAFIAYGQWSATRTGTNPAFLQDATAALGYLEAVRVPEDEPVVFVVTTADPNTAGLMGHMIRATLPAGRIPHAHVYVGTAQAYVEGRPVDTAVSRSSYSRLGRILQASPVAVILSTPTNEDFAAWVRQFPEKAITDRVAVVTGPPPPKAILPPTPLRAPVGGVAWWKLGLLAAATLAGLGLIGLGWTRALLGRWLRPGAILGLSPAVGVAALVVGGIVADRLGFRLAGVSGALTPAAVAAAGLAAAMLVRTGREPPGWTPGDGEGHRDEGGGLRDGIPDRTT